MSLFVKIMCSILVYCLMVSFTHGYVSNRNNCYDGRNQGSACNFEPFMQATFWPAYWTYHTGTLMFEPKKLD